MIDREAAVIKTTETLTATLARISGLPVRGFRDGKSRFFLFGSEDRTIKSVHTYRKALIFAQGIAIGRKRESMELLKVALEVAFSLAAIAIAILVICAPKLGTIVALGALTVMAAVKIFRK